MLLRLVSVMNLILFQVVNSIFKGENLNFVILLKKKNNVDLCSGIQRPISCYDDSDH